MTARLTKEFKTWENQFYGDRAKNQDLFQQDLAAKSEELRQRTSSFDDKIQIMTEENQDLTHFLETKDAALGDAQGRLKEDMKNLKNYH